MTKYEVNINTLLDLGLGFEAHFLLYCLYNKDNNQLLTYIKQCKKINTEVFKQLAIVVFHFSHLYSTFILPLAPVLASALLKSK